MDELNSLTYYCDIYSSFKHMADSKLRSHSNFVISIIPTTLRFFLRGIQQSLLDYIKRASIFCSHFFKLACILIPDKFPYLLSNLYSIKSVTILHIYPINIYSHLCIVVSYYKYICCK